MARAGSQVLSLFANALTAPVLCAHIDGRLRPGQLEQAIGWAPPASLRTSVEKMCDLRALARIELDDSALSVATELTPAGHELLTVASYLRRWLQEAPSGPIPLDDPAAHGIVKVLTAGWDAAMVRVLAERQVTLTELSVGIDYLSYPALKRRLARLRAIGLVAPTSSEKSPAYTATDWLRRAIAPIAAAGRWELLHDPRAEPISPLEVEAAFLLTLPLLELPTTMSGNCTLAVLLADGREEGEDDVAGVALEVERGAISSCDPEGSAAPSTWALGTAQDWMEALVDGQRDTLRMNGPKKRVAARVVQGLHETLFRL